jgi:glycosyltransferase involved in cell wall biosynthesis
MKVLQVLPSVSSRVGGTAFGVTALSRALQDAGAQVTIFATDLATPNSAPDARGNIKVSDLPPAAAGLDIRLFRVRHPYRFAYSPGLRGALMREVTSFDLVHINSVFSYPQFAAFSEASKRGVPHLVTPHGALDPLLRTRGKLQKAIAEKLWLRRMMDTAASICYTAEEEKALVQDLGFRAPAHVVPNVVDTKLYLSAEPDIEFRDRITGGKGSLVVCHGRLSWKKRLDVLVEALALLRARGLDTHLALIGPDDEGLGRQLMPQADALGIGDRLHLTGMLKGPTLASAVRAADVWALPSHSENFGVAVIEAMAASRPVVVSKHVNIAGDIASGDAGLVVDPTPPEVADAIEQLISRPELAGNLGEAASGFAHRYSGEVVASQMLEVYESILAGRRISQPAHELEAA